MGKTQRSKSIIYQKIKQNEERLERTESKKRKRNRETDYGRIRSIVKEWEIKVKLKK